MFNLNCEKIKIRPSDTAVKVQHFNIKSQNNDLKLIVNVMFQKCLTFRCGSMNNFSRSISWKGIDKSYLEIQRTAKRKGEGLFVHLSYTSSSFY